MLNVNVVNCEYATQQLHYILRLLNTKGNKNQLTGMLVGSVKVTAKLIQESVVQLLLKLSNEKSEKKGLEC